MVTCCSPLPRCNVCEFRFVGMPNEVCDDCEPFKCEKCENISTLAFKVITNTAKNEHMLVCHSCLHTFPVCRGCDKSFYPLNAKDAFCSNCNQNASDGICVNCEEPSEWLNDRLMCERCSEKSYTTQTESEFTNRHWCRICEVNEVAKSGDMCISCRSRQIVCPECQKNFMSAASSMCPTCLTKRYGER